MRNSLRPQLSLHLSLQCTPTGYAYVAFFIRAALCLRQSEMLASPPTEQLFSHVSTLQFVHFSLLFSSDANSTPWKRMRRVRVPGSRPFSHCNSPLLYDSLLLWIMLRFLARFQCSFDARELNPSHSLCMAAAFASVDPLLVLWFDSIDDHRTSSTDVNLYSNVSLRVDE